MNNKSNKFLLITTIFSIIILLIGATFSYFSFRNMSDNDALSIEAGKVSLGLSSSLVYSKHKLIPTNDNDIIKAYNNECIDDNGYGACLAYKLEISNFYLEQDIIGKIDFSVEDIDNLSYMVLNEDNSIYLDKTSVTGDTIKMPLGESFTLGKGTSINPTKKTFILLIWLTNLEENQDEYDAGGSFNATVTYSSVSGRELTASIDGYRQAGE